MIHSPKDVAHSAVFRFLSVLVLTIFFSTTILPPGYAQSIGLTLPLPGTMMNAGAEFSPVLFKGLTVHPENPLQFDFMVDSGTKGLKAEVIKKESERLAKYFLAAMTVPQDELWVNLSPFEENRIIPDELGKTELGRDMLAQDYLLKQLTASLMYPEKELGKKFWDTVRARAKKEYGVEEIPTDMFNKVWIVPDKAVVYEYGQTVYVVESRLKVMLEEDYAASRPNLRAPEPQGTSAPERVLTGEPGNRGTGELTKEIMRELIIPELEREVNQGAHFAPLRQIFHALILAKWYKEAVKESLLSQIYVDRHKILGVENEDPGVRDQIYARYLEAYQKGAFNYIKEDYDRLSNEIIPRQYFSGGEEFGKFSLTRVRRLVRPDASFAGDRWAVRSAAEPRRRSGDVATGDPAMLTVTREEALAYQEEVRLRMEGKREAARKIFYDDRNPVSFTQQPPQESLFHHIPVGSDVQIRQIYAGTRQIIQDVLGKGANVVSMDLNDIHVTIANDEIGDPQEFSISLDHLLREVSDDAQGIQPFSIELVGPQLASNGVVIMEFTTSAPEFLTLRRRAEARINDRKAKGLLSVTNRAFAPDIIHSTVSDIRGAGASPEKLRELFDRLSEYRKKISSVAFTANKLMVTHFREKDRRFLESRDIPPLGDTAMLAVSPQEALAYQQEMRERFEGIELKTRQILDPQLTKPEEVALKIRGNNSPGQGVDHGIFLGNHPQVRQRNREVQALVAEVLGQDAARINIALDEIHLTVAADSISLDEQLTMDQLGPEVAEEVKGIGPFTIQLIGPRLMPDMTVVMEYTTSAPEFLELRKRAGRRIEQRKKDEAFAGNKMFVPGIMHSTVTVIRDPSVSQEKLQRLLDRLAQYRTEKETIDVPITKIAAGSFQRETRRVFPSAYFTLKGDAAMLASEKMELLASKDAFGVLFDPGLTYEQQKEILAYGMRRYPSTHRVYRMCHSALQILEGELGIPVNRKSSGHDKILDDVAATALLDSKGTLGVLYDQELTYQQKRTVLIAGIRQHRSREFSRDCLDAVVILDATRGKTLPLGGSVDREASLAGRGEQVGRRGSLGISDASGSDKAMLASEGQAPGGIDMNEIDVERKGKGIVIPIDPAQLEMMLEGGVDGFAPIIIDVTPLNSVLPLLGLGSELDPADKREELEMAAGI